MRFRRIKVHRIRRWDVYYKGGGVGKCRTNIVSILIKYFVKEGSNTVGPRLVYDIKKVQMNLGSERNF